MRFAFGRTEVLTRVRENREAHQKAYDEAEKGYQLEVIELIEKAQKELEKAHKLAQKGKYTNKDAPRLNVYATPPENHVDDYDRVIDMLNMAVDDEISLEEGDFSKYVRDEWDWKEDFVANSSYYSGKFSDR